MFRKGLPIGTIVVILVIALAAIGVGYGLWSKVLFVSGTVATGNVNAEFVDVRTDDPGTEYDPGYGKHVASCEFTVTDQPGGHNDLLTITIANGYPSYSCTVNFSVKNSGTVPVMVQAFNFAGLPAVLDLTSWQGFIGTQIDPLESAPGYFTIHVRQEAEESANYAFSAAITLVQWNEYRATGAMALCQKDDSNWTCVPGATGVLYYPASGPTFAYDFNAEGLTPGTSYTLIHYYPDVWPGSSSIFLGSGVADADGDLHLVGSPNTGDLTNAKIWLVLSADFDTVTHQMIDWHPAAYLFEETLVTYDAP